MTLLQARFPDGLLPEPPTIGQNVAVNPDGTLDPLHDNDCGETCVASILSVATGFYLSPGCVRQALGADSQAGLTTGDELAKFMTSFGLEAQVFNVGDVAAWGMCRKLRHYGNYALMLGHWIAPAWLHWYLAYERSASAVHVMDPWTDGVVLMSRERLVSAYAGQIVKVS